MKEVYLIEHEPYRTLSTLKFLSASIIAYFNKHFEKKHDIFLKMCILIQRCM